MDDGLSAPSGRILEELKDEGASIWRAFVSEETLREAGKRNYARMWNRYQFHMARALKKAGATHIAWVADPIWRTRKFRTSNRTLSKPLILGQTFRTPFRESSSRNTRRRLLPSSAR